MSERELFEAVTSPPWIPPGVILEALDIPTSRKICVLKCCGLTEYNNKRTVFCMYVCVNVTCYIVLIFRTFANLDNKITAVTNNVLFQKQKKKQFVTDRSFVTIRWLSQCIFKLSQIYFNMSCDNIGITKRCVRRQKAIETLTKCILLSIFSEKKNQEWLLVPDRKISVSGDMLWHPNLG